MALNFSKQLYDGRFGRLDKLVKAGQKGRGYSYPCRIVVNCREVKTLDVKTFEMIQETSTKIGLAHTMFTPDEQSRAEDS